MFHVATGRKHWREHEFFASGAEQIETALAWLDPTHARERALDVGCGLGRTAVHLSLAFDHVDGIDISPTMVERARAMHDRPNLEFHLGSGNDLSGLDSDAYDLVYSYVVFQHVDEPAIIGRYLEEIARVLRSRGCAILQFDSRPARVVRRVYLSLPDWMLPTVHRQHVRRYPRDPALPERLFRQAGLVLEAERGRGTAEHLVKLRRAGSEPTA